MNNLLQKLNSCKLYRYITYLYDNHILIRYYLRYRVVLVYNYNKETDALDDLLFFRVLEGRVLKYEAEIHRSFLRLRAQVENLGFKFMRMVTYPPITDYDHHSIIDQNLSLEDGFHTLFYHRNFRRIHPWIKNFTTGEEKLYFQAAEVVEKIAVVTPVYYLPIRPGFEHRRFLQCRRDDCKEEGHAYGRPIYNTKLCNWENCCCYNVGWVGRCEVCGYFMHMCPYTPCHYIMSTRSPLPSMTTLRTHIRKYHHKNSKSKLVLIPLQVEELEEEEEVEIDELKMSLKNLLKRDLKEYVKPHGAVGMGIFEPYKI